MIEEMKKHYLEILKDELIPAMGCTEPISVAYAAALARKVLGELPLRVQLTVSANIIKNVKSVVVPNTGGLCGIDSAAAAGIVAGNADAELEVLCAVDENQKSNIQEYIDNTEIKIKLKSKIINFFIIFSPPFGLNGSTFVEQRNEI